MVSSAKVYLVVPATLLPLSLRIPEVGIEVSSVIGRIREVGTDSGSYKSL